MPTCIWHIFKLTINVAFRGISPQHTMIKWFPFGQRRDPLPSPVLGDLLGLRLILQSRASCWEHKTRAVGTDSLSWRISRAGSRPVWLHQPGWMMCSLESTFFFFFYLMVDGQHGALGDRETSHPVITPPPSFHILAFNPSVLLLPSLFPVWMWTEVDTAMVRMGLQSLTADLDESWQWGWEWE